MKFKFLALLALMLLPVEAYAATTRTIQASQIKNGSGLLKIPTTTPTASRACVFNGSSVIGSSSVTSTQLDALLGISGNIQSSLDSKLSGLTSIGNGESIVGDTTAGNVEIRTIKAGTGITVTGDEDEITISGGVGAPVNSLTFNAQNPEPGTPTEGQTVLYANANGDMKAKKDTGTAFLLGDISGGTNLGSGGSNVFKQKNGANLEYRQLKAGSNVTVTENTNDVTIAATGDISGGTNLGSGGSNVFSAKSGNNLQFRQLKAGSNITLTENTNDITIAASGGGGSSPTWTNVVGGITLKGTTTDPTPGTVSRNNWNYSINGKIMHLSGEWFQSANTGANNGSGAYYFTIPNSQLVDTAVKTLDSDTAPNSGFICQGQGFIVQSASLYWAEWYGYARTASTIAIYNKWMLNGGSANGFVHWNSGNWGLATVTSLELNLDCIIPIQ